jgi:hypothetical protein
VTKPESITAVLSRLLDYCQSRDWAGVDPYDALNSQWLTSSPILDRRLPRLCLTQCLKRSPVDFRALLRIHPTQNPKALALFLSAFVKMKRIGLLRDRQLVDEMIRRLKESHSPGQDRYCWGYSFPWQTRTVLVPRGAPNLVSTVFAANAFLDVYQALHDRSCLELALDAAHYVHELYWEDGGRAGFAYPEPNSKMGVHNANFLGAALLCRIDRICHEPKLAEAGIAAARYSATRQSPNGSWAYSDRQPWIDHFHTGYNLCALNSIIADTGSAEFEPVLRRGFQYYRNTFFREDGAPKYFSNRTYPIDIHCVAQSLITLTTLQKLDCGGKPQPQSILNWALKHLHDPQGYFYYQAYPFWKIRTAYMRWSQAWMALALATILEESHQRAAIS